MNTKYYLHNFKIVLIIVLQQSIKSSSSIQNVDAYSSKESRGKMIDKFKPTTLPK